MILAYYARQLQLSAPRVANYIAWSPCRTPVCSETLIICRNEADSFHAWTLPSPALPQSSFSGSTFHFPSAEYEAAGTYSRSQ